MIRRVIAHLAVLTAFAGIARAEEPGWDFELYDLAGRLHSISKVRTAGGARLTAIDFFSIDCEPCRKAIPEWTALATAHEKKGLRVVVVAVPSEDDREAAMARVVAWFKEHPVQFPVLWDRYGLVAKRYGVADSEGARLPQAFLLDRAGRLIKRSNGHAETIREVRKRLR